MLIGLHDLAKGRKLSKIVINRRFTEYLIFPICFVKGNILHFFTNLINSKLISELASSDNTVFLCINATQV